MIDINSGSGYFGGRERRTSWRGTQKTLRVVKTLSIFLKLDSELRVFGDNCAFFTSFVVVVQSLTTFSTL